MELHWPENPSPRVTTLEDGTQVIRTSSAGIGCHVLGCGLRVFVKDGEIKKVEGDPEQPISKGRLCVRCLTAVDYINDPNRILYPMKRDRAFRGDPDRFERISWDEAYDLIIENYERVVEEWGVNSVSVWCGTGREPSFLHFKFSNDLFGTKTTVHPNSGWSCFLPRRTVYSWMYGSPFMEYDYAAGFPDRYDDPRWECPKYMLIWGRDPMRSNPDGLWGSSMIELMKRGTKLIVVDPRVNWLATRAELHLQLRPGTDAALALGINNVLIEEDLYDHDFVERWTYGFEEFAKRCAEYPPERVEEITWVPAEKIRKAARLISEKPSSLCMGLPVDQNPNVLQIGHAVVAIFVLCGDIDIPGGLLAGQGVKTHQDTSEQTGGGDNPFAHEGLFKFDNQDVEPLGHDAYPAYDYCTNNTHPDYTLDVLESENGLPYPIKFAYFLNNNPLSCMCVEPKRFEAGLKKLEFICMADVVMTPSIVALADVVLPVAAPLERDGITSVSFGTCPGQFAALQKCVEPRGEAKSDTQILLDLYHKIYPHGAHQWDTVEDYLTDQLKGMADGSCKSYEELKESVFCQVEVDYHKHERGLVRQDGTPGFNTPTGRLELYSVMLQNLGEDPLPYYQEPYFSAISRPDLAEEYPLILTTGARRFTSFHSENRQIAKLREIHEWPTVDIHPNTARDLGIIEGSWVWVENHLGKAKLRAHLTETVDPRVVSADHGWWYPERDPKDLYDVYEANICSLIPNEMNGKLGLGTHYKCMECRVFLADEAPVPPSPVELGIKRGE